MSKLNITIPGVQEAQDKLKVVIRDAISEYLAATKLPPPIIDIEYIDTSTKCGTMYSTVVDVRQVVEVRGNKIVNRPIDGTPNDSYHITLHDGVDSANDVIWGMIYGGQRKGVEFVDGVSFNDDDGEIVIQISAQIAWIDYGSLQQMDVSDGKDLRFTKQMIDDLSATDFISILRNEYRKLLDGLERRKQDIEKSKST